MRLFYRLASTPLIRADKGKSRVVRVNLIFSSTLESLCYIEQTLQYFLILKQPSTFVDELKIRVRGGKGGDGAIAFTKYFAKENAGPDGGNGGNGGHVIFKVSFML